MRHLLGMERTPPKGRRIQDPFGLRAFPQVNGPAIDALETLHRVLDVEINAGAENPMIAVAEDDVYHHAHFHTAYVAGALDHVRACIHGVAELSAARLGDLVEPEQTGLRAFLVDGPPGSSGVMILEYMSHDALAALRQVALPVTLGSAVVSRGLEDHASFSTQAARADDGGGDRLHPRPRVRARRRRPGAAPAAAERRGPGREHPAGGPPRSRRRWPAPRRCSTRAPRTGRWPTTSPSRSTSCSTPPGPSSERPCPAPSDTVLDRTAVAPRSGRTAGGVRTSMEAARAPGLLDPPALLLPRRAAA